MNKEEKIIKHPVCFELIKISEKRKNEVNNNMYNDLYKDKLFIPQKFYKLIIKFK